MCVCVCVCVCACVLQDSVSRVYRSTAASFFAEGSIVFPHMAVVALSNRQPEHEHWTLRVSMKWSALTSVQGTLC